jgi:putative tricarboxylic transport membrane protein
MDVDRTERTVRARADLVTALVLLALGLAVIYLSWTMPRLEARHIHPATIPGLVPLLLGIGLTLCSALLVIRSVRNSGNGGWRELGSLLLGREARRVLVALGLVLTFSLVLVGWLPFWLAAMTFIFAFIVLFEGPLSSEPAPLMRSAFWAGGIAIVSGAGIYYVFQYLFLVRLP